jgi:outer membrane protein assembly factor BamB
LIEQLEQGSPEDFSADQLALIRGRLAGSPALAAALADRLRLEQYLAGTLGADNVSKEELVERAARLRQGGSLSKRAIAGWVAGLGLASVALYFAVRPFLPRRAPSVVGGGNVVVERAAKEDAADGGGDGEVGHGASKAVKGDEDRSAVEGKSSVARSLVTSATVAEGAVEDLGPARPLRDVVFEDIRLAGATSREEDLRKWFTAAGGEPHRFSERMVQNRRCGFFDGWVKLRGAWPKDGMLRLALVDHDRLRLHFFNGTAGVTLEYFQDQRHAWAAYAVKRNAGEVRPREPVLVGTDEERSYRTSPSGVGPIDVSWRGGELVVSRGDVRLLAAPLAEAPAEVYFEGHAGFRGLSVVRVIDEPVEKPAVDQRPVTTSVVAAKQEWLSETPAGSSFDKREDGSVELVAEKTKSPAWAGWKLPRRELCEVLLEVDSATAGAGVYVADEQGRPVDVVRFFRDSRSGGTTVGLTGAGDARTDQDHDPAGGPIPLVSERPWVRLVVGCGVFRAWVGPDGLHWAPAVTKAKNIPTPFATVGLFCKASDTKRSIRLKRIVIRELDGLTTLVGAKVRQRATAFATASDLSDWVAKILAARPADVGVDEWRRGCALATLGQGVNPQLGMALLSTLLDDVLGAGGDEFSNEARLKALADAALIANTWENHAEAIAFSARYRRLGERLFETGSTGIASGTPRPYSLLRAAQSQSPVASRHGVPAGVVSLARLELLAAVYDGRFEELERLCRTVDFWRFPAAGETRRDPLIDWAQGVAAERLGKRSPGRSTPMSPAWRHPLEDQTNADTFNLMAEFNAALESKAYQDAAGTIASATGKLVSGDSSGLLVDARDRDLHLSLANAVRLAMRDHPPLAAAMNEHFGPIARQRVQRAASEGDRIALEAAIVQFCGTEAASMAHVWLGNAALAVGEFAQALSHFELAAPHAAAGDRAEIAGRARLAAAYLGRDLGSPMTTKVMLGETELAASEFEELVKQLRDRAMGRRESTRDGPGRAVVSGPPPAALKLEKRGEFDAGTVDRPSGAPAEEARAAVDWLARQTSGVIEGDRVIYTSAYATTAFDRHSGSEKWRSGPSSSRSRLFGDSSIAGAFVAPSRPVFAAGRIFLRRATPALKLIAIDRENGRTEWESRLERQEAVMSDPVWVSGQLLAVVARQDERQTMTSLGLAAFDPESGEVRWRRPLVRLRSSWWSQPVCQVGTANEKIYVALGGAVVCCNSAGQIDWLRRSERVPAGVDSWSLLQAHDRPVIVGERLIVSQAGVRAVECLEAATGRRQWGRVFPDLLSVVGVAGDVIVVHTRDAIVGLKLASGETAWRYGTEGGSTPLLCGEKNCVLLSRNENRRLVLVWLDGKTGTEIGRSSMGPSGSGENGGMMLGPIAVDTRGRGWTLVSRDERSAKRDLCELISAGPAEAPGKMRKSAWELD